MMHTVFNNIHPVFNNIHPVFNKHSAALCTLLVALQHLHFLVYMPLTEKKQKSIGQGWRELTWIANN